MKEREREWVGAVEHWQIYRVRRFFIASSAVLNSMFDERDTRKRSPPPRFVCWIIENQCEGETLIKVYVMRNVWEWSLIALSNQFAAWGWEREKIIRDKDVTVEDHYTLNPCEDIFFRCKFSLLDARNCSINWRKARKQRRIRVVEILSRGCLVCLSVYLSSSLAASIHYLVDF